MPPVDDIRVVMALKVRDEEDVIEHNLRYHHAQGVDFFIVTDNASIDRRPRSSDAGSRRPGWPGVIDEPRSNFFAAGSRSG